MDRVVWVVDERRPLPGVQHVLSCQGLRGEEPGAADVRGWGVRDRGLLMCLQAWLR